LSASASDWARFAAALAVGLAPLLALVALALVALSTSAFWAPFSASRLCGVVESPYNQDRRAQVVGAFLASVGAHLAECVAAP